MGRIKVKLRSYPISGGRLSLYLDYYPKIRHPRTGKLTRVETLGMYVYAKPKGDAQKRHNTLILSQADAIQGLRQRSVIDEEFGFLDDSKYRADFLDYFKQCALKNNANWVSAYNHFVTFVKGSCTFEEITLGKCMEYQRYIQTAPNLRNGSRGLHINTAAGYFKIFKYVVGFAYRDKWLKEDIFPLFGYLTTKETHREFLTPAELYNLSRTHCEIEVLKRASLFSCLTGLRVSDVTALEWKSIVPNIKGDGFNVRLRMQKTDKELSIPLSDDALRLCGSRKTGRVFDGFQHHMLRTPLSRWIAAAGITKHITFHCFRHTYAVLQLASGTDIYTVSRMLGHKHVSTTEVYLDLMEDTKVGTIDKIQIYIEPLMPAA